MGKRTFNAPDMVSDQGQVKWFCKEAMRAQPPLEGPLRLVVTMFRNPPASWSHKKRAAAKWITSAPDWDNWGKQIGDALNGLAYKDDAQIASGRVDKLYRMDGPEEVTVFLEELAP